MNKRGDETDLLILLITMFIFAVGFFIIAFIIPTITSGLKTAGLNDSTEGAAAIETLENFGPVIINRGTFFLLIGLAISTLITSFLTVRSPIFLFLWIIFLALTVFLGTYLGNAYETITSNPTFSDILAEQTLINLVMNNIVVFLIGVGALSMIIVFAKFSGGGGGGRRDRI